MKRKPPADCINDCGATQRSQSGLCAACRPGTNPTHPCLDCGRGTRSQTGICPECQNEIGLIYGRWVNDRGTQRWQPDTPREEAAA